MVVKKRICVLSVCVEEDRVRELGALLNFSVNLFPNIKSINLKEKPYVDKLLLLLFDRDYITLILRRDIIFTLFYRRGH